MRTYATHTQVNLTSLGQKSRSAAPSSSKANVSPMEESDQEDSDEQGEHKHALPLPLEVLLQPGQVYIRIRQK